MSAIAGAAVDSPMTNAQLDQLSINCIRTLSIDAVQQANSGHPGTPMALAPLVYTLWNRVMRFDPKDPIWPNRDRFLLSNGHASMLLWSVLFLTGTRAVNAEYERLGEPAVSLDDIKHFRQLGSKAPGHPEYHLVSGVEATTGPLGQGVATSVGMAIARGMACRPLQSAGLRDLRLQHLCDLRRRLHDGRRRVGSGLARGPSRPWTTSAGSTTTTTSRSKAIRASPSPRTSRRGSWDTAGTFCASATPTTSSASSRRSISFKRPRGVQPSSFWTAISATARRTSRIPPRLMASRSARRRFASPSATTDGPRTPSSWFRPPCPSTSPPESARVAGRPMNAGPSCSRLTGRNFRSSRPRST